MTLGRLSNTRHHRHRRATACWVWSGGRPPPPPISHDQQRCVLRPSFPKTPPILSASLPSGSVVAPSILLMSALGTGRRPRRTPTCEPSPPSKKRCSTSLGPSRGGDGDSSRRGRPSATCLCSGGREREVRGCRSCPVVPLLEMPVVRRACSSHLPQRRGAPCPPFRCVGRQLRPSVPLLRLGVVLPRRGCLGHQHRRCCCRRGRRQPRHRRARHRRDCRHLRILLSPQERKKVSPSRKPKKVQGRRKRRRRRTSRCHRWHNPRNGRAGGPATRPPARQGESPR